MELSEFDYHLPDELIAQHAAAPRDSARLMIVSKNKITHKRFSDVIDSLMPGDVLALNSTMVLEAKLIGKKESGAPCEIILTKGLGNLEYECHIKTRNPNVGSKIILEGGYAQIVSQKSVDLFVVRLSDETILAHAHLPNPPYIKRTVDASEYQTVYAKKEEGKGSLAAPTAGLHFTKTLLDRIKKKGVKIVYIKLHVGFGTFLPIYGSIESHKTEPEYYEISEDNAKLINERKGRLVVVGTTTLKALETASKDGMVEPKSGWSDIFIYPGHKFSCNADVLITNFHLPRSSLLLLTCAFGGKERIMDAYSVAVREKYRFYSLGDAMLIERLTRQ